MQLSIKIPSKTFLAGEYNILHGGTAILINTKPNFVFTIKNSDSHANPFHPQSPAGLFIQQHYEYFQQHKIYFNDPHNGLGGFGGSGAEFLGAYCSKMYIKNGGISNQSLSMEQLLTEYQQYTIGNKTSGADLVAQMHGKITMYEKNQQQATTLSWDFPNLGFLLVPTKQNINTHQHLQTLDYNFNYDLENIVFDFKKSLYDNNEELLVDATQQFHQHMQQQKLCHPNTVDLIDNLLQYPEILAAKGCGALGADVMLLIYQTNQLMTVQDILRNNELSAVATENDLATAIQFEYQFNTELESAI